MGKDIPGALGPPIGASIGREAEISAAIASTLNPNAALKTAAIAATNAVRDAAVNASKVGVKTSEFKAVVGGIILSGLLAGLNALSIIPGPWMLPAIAISTGISIAAYATGRSKVKAVALEAATVVISHGHTSSDNIGNP